MKKVFITLLITIPLLVFPQSKKEDKRGGKFYFSVGPEYRVTPIYNFSTSSEEGAQYTNVDSQNSGTAINFDVEFFIINNLSLGYTTSFRYDLVTAPITAVVKKSNAYAADYKIIVGNHFYLSYYFKLLKKGEFFVNAGVSFLNNNTSYNKVRAFYDSNGNYTSSISIISDYSFSANKIALGYKRNKGQLALGLYVTGKAPYFEENTKFIIPFVKYSYTFGKL